MRWRVWKAIQSSWKVRYTFSKKYSLGSRWISAGSQLRCRFHIEDLPSEVTVPSNIRHNLCMVVKEAINNTVKHAHAKELKLQIGLSDEKLKITIEDNGCGFDQPPSDDGADGLRNMRQRLADIGGECWIQGRPGGGTKVDIELPWSKIGNSS